jgi:hypothetical protein
MTREVEAPVDVGWQRVRVGLDPLDLDAGTLGDRAAVLERGGREVDRGHARAALGEDDRVDADVRLDVKNVEPGDVRIRRVERALLPVAERARARDERLDVVVRARRRLGMDLRHALPEAEVRLARVVHRNAGA